MSSPRFKNIKTRSLAGLPSIGATADMRAGIRNEISTNIPYLSINSGVWHITANTQSRNTCFKITWILGVIIFLVLGLTHISLRFYDSLGAAIQREYHRLYLSNFYLSFNQEVNNLSESPIGVSAAFKPLKNGEN